MTFAIVLLGWIFSLCLHEFGHAIVAYYGGDTTVKEKGYLTFNPLRYTDPMMSIALPLLFLFMGGIGLPGGAVYIERWRLRSRGWWSAVSLAGPTANLLVLIALSIALRFAPSAPYAMNSPWPGIAFLAQLQGWALVINLIPLPPFDGYGIVEPFLPYHWQERVNSVRGWLPWVVLAMLWFVPIVAYMIRAQVDIIAYVFGVPYETMLEGYFRFRFWEL